jgi:peptidoglycan hydrolase-like protein with peptidoglycan-binding domain
MMKRTLSILGLSVMLAMPLLANGQVMPSTPGTGSGPGVGGSSSGARMGQEERRGQTDVQPGDVRQAQERLKEVGFNPGPADGQLGVQTKEAIKEYQKAQGLPQTGQLDEPTRDLLMVQRPKDAPAEMQAPRGFPREETRPGESMPGGRTPNEPGAGSRLPGSSSPGQ